MNVLITGGAGYVGTELTYALNECKEIDRIIVYDNFDRDNYNLFLGQSKLKGGKVHLLKGDLLDSRKLKATLGDVDIVVHLAAKVTTPFANHTPHVFDQVNNWGTAELAYSLEQSKVQKLIHASSISVYGTGVVKKDGEPVENPGSFYGVSKKKSEEHLQTLKKVVPNISTFRLGNVYGYSKSMRFDSVINKFMFESNFYNRICIYGSGEQVRSFIQINRLVNVLKQSVLGNYNGDTYNLVESTYSINDVVDTIKEIYPELETIYVNKEMEMRGLEVQPDSSFNELNYNNALLKDLKAFKKNFTF